MSLLKKYAILICSVSLITVMSCNTDQGITPRSTGMIVNKSVPGEGFPAGGDQVFKVVNESNVITGYYFSSDPTTIFPIGKSEVQKINSRSSSITSLVGDMDNFGYGGTDSPPCEFYDFSEAVDDLGIFDRELEGRFEVESWTHDFTGDVNYCSGFEASSVTIEIREFFSDPSWPSSISIDGNVLEFEVNGNSACNSAVVQTFTFSGAAASFANDGVINITFSENGDDISLDWSSVTIEGDCNISIDGCDTGVPNHQFEDGSNMMDLILACAASSANHGDFVSCVAHLTNAWKKAGLITGAQKDAIMDCAAGADIP